MENNIYLSVIVPVYNEEGAIALLHKEILAVCEKIGQPFEHEAKLQSFSVRQKELEEALDITKNQAASSLSTEEAGQTTEPETEAVQNNNHPSHAKTAPEKNGRSRNPDHAGSEALNRGWRCAGPNPAPGWCRA